MLDVFHRMFGRRAVSAEIAKDRLRLVLIQDRTEINPGDLEEIKRQLVAAVSNRLDVDLDGIDLHIQSDQGRGTIVVANIPVRAKARKTEQAATIRG